MRRNSCATGFSEHAEGRVTPGDTRFRAFYPEIRITTRPMP